MDEEKVANLRAWSHIFIRWIAKMVMSAQTGTAESYIVNWRALTYLPL